MARPKKQYCDYFSHDRDMRNHRKIKALRTKFGVNGYAVWVMILEVLTGNNDNYINCTTTIDSFFYGLVWLYQVDALGKKK